MACWIECACWLNACADQLVVLLELIASDVNHAVDLLPMHIGDSLREGLLRVITPIQRVLACIDDDGLPGVSEAIFNV